jgi:hypothetical protein
MPTTKGRARAKVKQTGMPVSKAKSMIRKKQEKMIKKKVRKTKAKGKK